CRLGTTKFCCSASCGSPNRFPSSELLFLDAHSVDESARRASARNRRGDRPQLLILPQCRFFVGRKDAYRKNVLDGLHRRLAELVVNPARHGSIARLLPATLAGRLHPETRDARV